MRSYGRIDVLGEDDHDDPILSVVNLIDVFLVVIGVLLIVIVENPLNPFSNDEVVVVKNPGRPDMEMVVKEGETLTHYTSSGEIGEGQGVRAGVTYRLEDGSMIYVPESAGGERR
ncbi:MAG: DUF2149 domain-containing protein [Gammaproteobacteria bacterium]|nr:DUF2149 domain-containing protein [Gammaproteobacteria bacterium]